MYYIGQRDCKDIKPKDDKYLGSSQIMHIGGWFQGRHFEPIFNNPDYPKYLTKKILHIIPGAGSANVLEIFEIEDYRQKYGKENIYNISDGGHGRGYLGEMVCERISETRKKLYQNPEFAAKQADILKIALSRPETREKMSKSAIARGAPITAFRDKTGNKNPMFGKNHSDKTKNKVSNTKKEKNKSLEIYGAKGRKWYHNPVTNEAAYFSILDTIPANWIQGRGKIKRTKPSKNIRKQVKCIETTEAWLSLTDFAREKGISISYASQILEKGIHENLHYKFIKTK
jgi:hypothetical protein